MTLPLGSCASAMPVTVRMLNNGEYIPSGSFMGSNNPVVYPDQVYVFAWVTNAGENTTLQWEFSFNGGVAYGTAGGTSNTSAIGTSSSIYYGNFTGISGFTGTIYYRLKTIASGVTITSPVYSFVK